MKKIAKLSVLCLTVVAMQSAISAETVFSKAKKLSQLVDTSNNLIKQSERLLSRYKSDIQDFKNFKQDIQKVKIDFTTRTGKRMTPQEVFDYKAGLQAALMLNLINTLNATMQTIKYLNDNAIMVFSANAANKIKQTLTTGNTLLKQAEQLVIDLRQLAPKYQAGQQGTSLNDGLTRESFGSETQNLLRGIDK